MDRRMFLRSLLGTGVIAAAPRVIYAFAPPGGWRRTEGGVLALNTFTRMLGETDSQLRARIYKSMAEVERDFGPPTNMAFLEAVQALRRRRDQRWFL